MVDPSGEKATDITSRLCALSLSALIYSLNPKGPKTKNVSKPPLHNTIYGSK